MRAPNATVGGPHARRVAALKRLPGVPDPSGRRTHEQLAQERKTLTERVAAGPGAKFRKNVRPKATTSF